MEGNLYLALNDGIAQISPEGMMMRCAHMDGALALCAGEDCLFCADRSGALFRLDGKTLMPRALGCGGPGVCAMCLSPHGERLYALLGEADSVLMSEAKSCRPLALNRCGANPKSLVCCGELLAAAGGESCRVHLYSAKTLDSMGEIMMPGPVYGAACENGVIYALCLAQDMGTLLVAAQGERRAALRLEGMPGCLHIDGNRIYAATQGWLHVIAREELELLGKQPAPGKPDRILAWRNCVILRDPLSECVFASLSGGAWKRLCRGVLDAALCLSI